MIIDLTIIHDGVNLNIKSEAAKFSDIKPATVALSKIANQEIELIEGIGENWTTADLENLALLERGKYDRIYRVINPFSPESFEPDAAFMTVRFYCLKVHRLIQPRFYQFRALLKIDNFDFTLCLPHYNLVSADKRLLIETRLQKIAKHLKIE